MDVQLLFVFPIDGPSGSQGFLSKLHRVQATKVSVRMETIMVTFSTNRMTLHMTSPRTQVSVTSQITVTGMQRINRIRSARAKLDRKLNVAVRK